MKTVKFLTHHNGELSYTPKAIVKVFDPATDSDKLTLKTTALMSSDDWRNVEVDAYGTADVDLPDWVDADQFAANIHFQVSLKWFKGFGGDMTWDGAWFWKLSGIKDTALRLACIKLLKTKNFRSDFRRSLRDQLVNWLDGRSTYSNPFSPKQAAALTSYVAIEAKRLDSALYLAGRYAA